MNKPELKDTAEYNDDYDIAGIVKSYDKESQTAVIEQRTKVYYCDIVEVIAPGGGRKIIQLLEMSNEEGRAIDCACLPKMIYTIKCKEDLEEGSILIRAKDFAKRAEIAAEYYKW